MSKKRVNDIAKEQGMSVKDLLLKLQAAGIDAAAPSATVDEALALRALGSNGAAAERAPRRRQEPTRDRRRRPQTASRRATRCRASAPPARPAGAAAS